MHAASRLLSPAGLYKKSQGLLGMAILQLVLLTGFAPAQSHFSKCTSHTGNNATVIIPSASSILVGNRVIQRGDEIAVFDGEGRCVGAVQWTGENVALTVWGTNELTPEKDGLKQGETMHFRVWNVSEEQEWGGIGEFVVVFNDEKPYLATENVYAPDRIYVIDSLHFDSVEQAFR